MSSLHRPLVSAACVVLASCAAPWRVIQLGPEPSPLRGVTDVAVYFDYSVMTVDGVPLASYIPARLAEDPQYQKTWDDLMLRYEEAVLAGLRPSFPAVRRVQQGNAPLVIRFQPQAFQMGKFIPYVLPPTRMNTLVFYDMNNAPVEGISFTTEIGVSIVNPSIFQHIGPLGTIQGSTAAQYLTSR